MDDFRRRYGEARQRRLEFVDYSIGYPEAYAADVERPRSCPACYCRTLREHKRTVTREWIQTHLRCDSCGFRKTDLDVLKDNAASYRTREKA